MKYLSIEDHLNELAHSAVRFKDIGAPDCDAIDFLGMIRDLAKQVKAIEETAKAPFLDMETGTILEGLEFKGSIVHKIDWRLKTKEVQEEMGAAWWEKRCKLSESYSVRLAVRKD